MANKNELKRTLDLLQKSERAAELHPFLHPGPLWHEIATGCGTALLIVGYDTSFPIRMIGLLMLFTPTLHSRRAKNIKIKFPPKLNKTRLLLFLGLALFGFTVSISWAIL